MGSSVHIRSIRKASKPNKVNSNVSNNFAAFQTRTINDSFTKSMHQEYKDIRRGGANLYRKFSELLKNTKNDPKAAFGFVKNTISSGFSKIVDTAKAIKARPFKTSLKLFDKKLGKTLGNLQSKLAKCSTGRFALITGGLLIAGAVLNSLFGKKTPEYYDDIA